MTSRSAIFNGSDELDYCDVTIASDGRSKVFLTWDRASEEPMRLAAHGIDPSPFHSMENLIGNTAWKQVRNFLA